MVSVTILQDPLFADARMSLVLPAVKSPALAVYVVLSADAFPKVPLPSVVHVPLPVVEVPFNEATGLETQTSLSVPAFAVGALLIVMIMVSLTGKHPPFPVVTRMMFTLPTAVSAALGV